MPALCLYLQVHQPYRLRPYSFFEAGRSNNYFDTQLTCERIQSISERCYIPVGEHLVQVMRAHRGRFRIALSLTGTAVELMRDYAPRSLEVMKEMVETGCVELIGETYHHSLASLMPEPLVFCQQVRRHAELMQREFGVIPRVFCNTELIFSDAIGAVVEECGFVGACIEGVDEVLAGRSPDALYCMQNSALRLLPRNCDLSNALALQVHSVSAADAQSSARRCAGYVREKIADERVALLCLGYETFARHYQCVPGVSHYIGHLAEQLLQDPQWRFVTPSQIVAEQRPAGELHVAEPRSWAKVRKDVSLWQGNRMQRSALQHLSAVEATQRDSDDTLGRLQAADHFYNMSNMSVSDQAGQSCAQSHLESYSRSFESPYEAFITYMNVLRGVASDPDIAVQYTP